MTLGVQPQYPGELLPFSSANNDSGWAQLDPGIPESTPAGDPGSRLLDPQIVVELLRAGYQGLLPVAPPAAQMSPNSQVEPGKVPSDRGRYGWRGVAGWTKQPYSAKQLQAQIAQYGAGLGINTTLHPFLDVDVTDDRLAQAIEATLARILRFPLKRIGRAPKFAVPCSYAEGAEPFSKMVLRLRDSTGHGRGMIEVLSKDRFIVLAGTHPRTKNPYVWHKGELVGGVELLAKIPPESLPCVSSATVTEQLLPALAEALHPFGVTISVEGGRRTVEAASVDQASLLAPSLERLAEVVAAIPNEADHDAYVIMGRAIRAAAGEDHLSEGFEIYEEWASRGKDSIGGTHPPDVVWDSLRPPHAIGWQYILAKAQGHINVAPDVFDADLTVAPAPDVPPRIALMNARYIVVPDGIYCTEDGVIRTPCKVSQFLRNEPGLYAEWNGHSQRARARRIVFDPSLPPLAVTNEVLNTYPGLALKPDADGDSSLIRAHILDVICSGDSTVEHWLMSWLADIVVNPKGKCGTAVALVAPPGSGKSVLGAIMGRILGRSMSADIADDARLLGRFNGHLEQLLFIEAAEAVWAGDVRAFGKLKDLLTAQEMSYELKGRTPHSGPNYTRILFTSNERRAVPVALDDRRFSVLDVSDRYAEGKPGAATYWSNLWAQVNSGGCAAFLYDLLAYPTNRELIRHPLQTEARRIQQAENLDPLMTWLVTFADSPPHSLELDCGLQPGEFRTDDLYARYMDSLRGSAAARYPVSKIGFGRWLSSLSKRGLDVVNGQVGGREDRRRTKRFPPLPALRTWLETQAAMPEWDLAEQWPGVAP